MADKIIHGEYITVEQMRAKIKELRDRDRSFIEHGKGKKNYKLMVYYEQTSAYFNLWVNEGSVSKSKCKHYVCRRDDQFDKCPIMSPSKIWANVRQYAKFGLMEDAGFSRDKGKVSGIMFRNKKYEGKWVEAVGYDMNSAYGWGACQDLPDTDYGIIGTNGIVGKGQIGFDRYGDIRYEGEWASTIFWVSEEKWFDKYMNKWYDIKSKSSGREKKNAKDHIVVAVGYLEKRNPWLRAAIIGHVNRLIRELTGAKYNYELGFWETKGDVLFGNTDSIVVKKGSKLDVELGSGMGQWKIENKGWFAYKGFNSQWKGKKPKVRGVMSVKLSAEDDITDLNIKGNKYSLWTWDDEIKDLKEVVYCG